MRAALASLYWPSPSAPEPTLTSNRPRRTADRVHRRRVGQCAVIIDESSNAFVRDGLVERAPELWAAIKICPMVASDGGPLTATLPQCVAAHSAQR